MKFVFLDVKTIGDDIDLSRFDLFGEVVKYPFSTQQEVPERIQDADVIIVNKIQVNEASIGAAKISNWSVSLPPAQTIWTRNI